MAYMSSLFRECLLKILQSGWFFWRHLMTMRRNFLPRLVLTLELKGGLYHVMSLFLSVLVFGMGSGLYVNL